MKRVLYLAMLLAFNAQAEQQYISDKLVVSVYAEANQESERLTTLESGDAVESLENLEGFTRVRLSDGREGFIRSTYLTNTAPAVVRIKELQKEQAGAGASSEELKQLKERNAQLASQLETLKTQLTQATAQGSEPVVAPDPPPRADIDPWSHAAAWSAGVAAVAGLLGFAFGHRRIAKRIEKKYGKLKIY